MKKRILFVDDEVNILKGLKRSLRPERKQWDMEFAEGGQNALDLLAKESFDVVVTDMRMPQMDGATLLKIIQERYPMLVRIILSGYSDQEMVMKSVKSAHQYLAKPCETAILIATIARACSLRDFLNQQVLQDLLGGIETIPSLPTVYLQIMEELNSSEACVETVSDIIAKDMGMTAKVLQMVNSSFFGMSRHISGTKDAVSFLGMDVIKTLVLGIEIFSKLSKSTMSIISEDDIHNHSIRTGVIAKRIAVLEKMDKEIIEDILMASMLHDLGKLLLCQYFQDEYKTVVALEKNEKMAIFKAERQVFGVSHAEVGAYLLGLWGLPENIVEGIAFHHEPNKLGVDSFELCGIIHVADRLERNGSSLLDNPEEIDGLDRQYLASLGLESKILLWQKEILTLQ